jgi:hypothetical protein
MPHYCRHLSRKSAFRRDVRPGKEQTLEFHVIELAKCVKVELPKEEGFCSINLWDKDQMIEIAEVRGTSEESCLVSCGEWRLSASNYKPGTGPNDQADV